MTVEQYKIVCILKPDQVARLKRYRDSEDEPIAAVIKRLAFAQADLIDRGQG